MNLMAVFTAPPEFTVLHGRDEIGRTDPFSCSPTAWKDHGYCCSAAGTGGSPGRTGNGGAVSSSPRRSGGRARWLSDGVGGLS